MRRGSWWLGWVAAAASSGAATLLAAVGPAIAATTTTPTTPVPGTVTPPLMITFPGLATAIVVRWRDNGDVSRVTTVRITRLPSDAMLTVSCRGAVGCPTRTVLGTPGPHDTVHRRLTGDATHLHRLTANLLKLQFHAGARVVFTVSDPHHRRASTEAIIGDGIAPVIRRLP